MSSVVHAIAGVPELWAYVIIGALVFGEAAVFIGFVLPGETAVLLGGALASHQRLSLPMLCALVVGAAVVGDSVGYEVGRRLGPRVLKWRLLARHDAKLTKATAVLRRRGGPAVFLGRFTAFLRAVTPGLAGVSRMPYPTFLVFNASGGLVWGVGFCLLGYFAGASYEKVAGSVGRGTAIAVAAVVILALAVWHIRRKLAERRADPEPAVAATPDQP